jgi:hypothetical protein
MDSDATLTDDVIIVCHSSSFTKGYSYALLSFQPVHKAPADTIRRTQSAEHRRLPAVAFYYVKTSKDRLAKAR